MTVSKPLNAKGVMARAWVIFGETYSYPATPFRSIGRKCFTWALNKAWAEARAAAALAATSTEELLERVAGIEREIETLRYRGFAVNVVARGTELRGLVRPMVAELFRRSVEAEANHKLAA